jgi:hypothetical protein
MPDTRALSWSCTEVCELKLKQVSLKTILQMKTYALVEIVESKRTKPVEKSLKIKENIENFETNFLPSYFMMKILSETAENIRNLKQKIRNA